MTIRPRLIRLAAVGAIVAGGALAATTTAVLAYPAPATSAHETQGCATVVQGAQCTFQFQFIDQNGNGVSGLPVTFTVSGVPGSTVTPTGTTDPGFVSTTFTASTTNTGTAIITASSGNVSASASTSVTSSPGSGGLPGTSASPPGPSSLLYLALGLALMIVLGGAITLRRSRSTAS